MIGTLKKNIVRTTKLFKHIMYVYCLIYNNIVIVTGITRLFRLSLVSIPLSRLPPHKNYNQYNQHEFVIYILINIMYIIIL